MTLIYYLVITGFVYAFVGVIMFVYLTDDHDWESFPAFVGACIWPVVAYKGIRNYVVENIPEFREEFRKSFGKEKNE